MKTTGKVCVIKRGRILQLVGMMWVLILMMSCASLNRGDKEAILLVANKHSNTLSFVDPRSFKVLTTIATGPNPHEIVLTPDQKFAYLSNYAPPGNSISVVDLVQRKHVKQISTDEYGRIHVLRVFMSSIWKASRWRPS